MCGRFTLTAEPGVVARRFGAPPTHGGGSTPRGSTPRAPARDAPSYNIAPTQTVVTVTDDGIRHLEPMRWGLIPSWAKDAKFGSRLINARAETLAEKPAFREALRRRRCLIPADGFYEWVTVPGRKAKQPMHIRLRSGEPFAFAGLWDEWRPPEGGPAVRTCTIVTTTPNELMATLHHRMPVILDPETEAVWLDPAIVDPDRLLPLLAPYPAAAMEAYAVAPAVNSVTNNSAQLLLPIDLPG